MTATENTPDSRLTYEQAIAELGELEPLQRKVLLAEARRNLPDGTPKERIVLFAARTRRRRRRWKTPTRPEWQPGQTEPAAWTEPVARTLEEERRRQMQLLEEREREYQCSLKTETNDSPDPEGTTT